MLKRYCAGTAGAEHLGIGPLGSYIDGFATRLVREGYTPSTVQEKLHHVIHLSRWLERRKLQAADLDEERLGLFLRYRRRCGAWRSHAPTSWQLLSYLRGLGCIPTPPERIDDTPLRRIERDFERFLSSERGLKPVTLVGYLRPVRRFLLERFGREEPRLDQLCPRDVNRFILQRAQGVRRSYAKLMVTALRSFLRFLQQRGAISINLAAAVPSVANWRLSHLPQSLTPEQVARLLACCDRSTPIGQRDYAILLLLAHLGLRAGEVVAMSLEDLDWGAGEFVVHGKGDRLERLPLPREVGAALVEYLRHVRPPCSTRRLFIRMNAPRCGFADASAICDVVRRALARAGLDPEFKGAHLLRHSLATNLLRRGASLDEIGQLLRHCHPDTTQIYAKVDLGALRGIALPWPGGAS
jgi:site-specific recombinase XerD